MANTENIAVYAVETPNRTLQVRDVDLATQGWGWPDHEPTLEAQETWLLALDTVREQVDLNDNIGKQVATLIVDSETRAVRNWELESDVEEGR